MRKDKTVLVTVGSTRFDGLIMGIQQKSVQEALISQGYSKIIVQYGKSEEIFNEWKPINGIEVSGFDYCNDMEKEFERSSLIISHAGSGSIIEALELKKQLIVVVNETLMDNHQKELTEVMRDEKYLISSTPENLLYAIKDLNKNKLKPFILSNESTFQKILDNQMGFS
ncbi:hypothetical protein T552_02029 [Pneumocystis carinii B80]|uniref:UDP-N-acetylglucosamine transferase subunit ALG13 n=1 Tax=Pneumocystis carinii (strain B80) TaxID=1408658 RepID=A0A0W4ZII1_PNEC8|nr:hypothetical protein T552_02029 [Pneumocystis carinii B80]KTW28170.1 hypothetical protein T552_02029 [Pneumocystis carinii B80]